MDTTSKKTEKIGRKQRGYSSENVVAQFLKQEGYDILETNFTLRGGELDLIAVKDGLLVFVEVKDVTGSDIFINPLSKSKMSTLKRSIFHYVQKIGYSGDIRCDCFFVKNNHIIERFEGIIFE